MRYLIDFLEYELFSKYATYVQQNEHLNKHFELFFINTTKETLLMLLMFLSVSPIIKYWITIYCNRHHNFVSDNNMNRCWWILKIKQFMFLKIIWISKYNTGMNFQKKDEINSILKIQFWLFLSWPFKNFSSKESHQKKKKKKKFFFGKNFYFLK